MAWYLMYLYDPQVPDVKPMYRFFALQNILQEYSKEAETGAQVVAKHVWEGFQSGFSAGKKDGKSKLSNPEVVWRVKLEMPAEGSGSLDNDLADVFKMAEEMELTAGGEDSKRVSAHEPDPTAEL